MRPGDNQVSPSQRSKGGTTRYRRCQGTVDLEVLWSRTSKLVSHQSADLQLDALTNRKQVEVVFDERRDMEERPDAHNETGSGTENRLKLRCIGSMQTLMRHREKNSFFKTSAHAASL